MASETKAFAELPELIFTILVVVVLGFFFTISYHPNLLYSEIHTTEISAISSILPKDTVISIEFEKKITLEKIEDNTFVISVEDEYIQEEAKKIPYLVSIEQQQNSIILSKN
jgi:hypothetical protein